MNDREIEQQHRQYCKRIMMECVADAETILYESLYKGYEGNEGLGITKEPIDDNRAISILAAELFTCRARPLFYYAQHAKDKQAVS